jgi:formylglycine-generating enzyme required for sulfatase activity
MGTSEENDPDSDASPPHQVTLTQPFYLGKYEVTQEQWEKIMGSNPSHFHGAKRPVEMVSWNACQEFLAKLQARTGRKFALPTEAQWEFACRAGTRTPGVSATAMPRWETTPGTGTTPARRPTQWERSNPMHGVCMTCMAMWRSGARIGMPSTPTPSGDTTDPSGPSAGDSRVLRGGAWGDDSGYLRCTYRNCNGPDGANDGIGLRCVMLVTGSAP